MTEIILPTRSVPAYASLGVFPLSAPDGAVAVALNTDFIYVFNAPTSTWILAAGGSSSGTVTSVALSVPGFLSVAGSPITTSGLLAVTLNTETANTIFSGPTTGAAANPTFRGLVTADIPSLSAIYVTQSEVAMANGVASLDGSGKVPVAQLPSVVMEYQGAWNPSTNIPTLSDGTGTNGNVYYVTALFAGPISGLSDPSMVNFQIGDLIIYSSSIGAWQLVTPAAGVSSVNGMQGAVSLGLGNLTNVVLSTPSNGQYIQFNGTNWVNVASLVTYQTEADVLPLNSTDISNQYKDLTHVAAGINAGTNSISLSVVGGPQQEKGVDYTVSLTGGMFGNTRITFAGDLATGGAAALVSGDILMVQYAF